MYLSHQPPKSTTPHRNRHQPEPPDLLPDGLQAGLLDHPPPEALLDALQVLAPALQQRRHLLAQRSHPLLQVLSRGTGKRENRERRDAAHPPDGRHPAAEVSTGGRALLGAGFVRGERVRAPTTPGASPDRWVHLLIGGLRVEGSCGTPFWGHSFSFGAMEASSETIVIACRCEKDHNVMDHTTTVYQI